MSNVNFEYGIVSVKDIQCEKALGKRGKPEVKKMIINNQEVYPSKRFWKSFQMRFRLSTTVFRYYNHAEVFERICEVSPNNKVRYCLEKVEGHKPVALGVTNPNQAVIPYNHLEEILGDVGYDSVSYSKGCVRSMHQPSMAPKFTVAGEGHVGKFCAEIPIDGVGKPNFYLSMLRQVCTNGMIGYAPAFRSEIQIGKGKDDAEPILRRAIESYNNEEGFGAIRERLENAALSWASVDEAYNLQKLIMDVHGSGGLVKVGKLVLGGDSTDVMKDIKEECLQKLASITGDLNHLYGLSRLDSMSVKKRQAIPAGKASVYDLINCATELGTHYASPTGNMQLQAYVGNLISNEYDLEKSKEAYGDYRDFFIRNEKTAEVMTEMNSRTGF